MKITAATYISPDGTLETFDGRAFLASTTATASRTNTAPSVCQRPDLRFDVRLFARGKFGGKVLAGLGFYEEVRSHIAMCPSCRAFVRSIF